MAGDEVGHSEVAALPQAVPGVCLSQVPQDEPMLAWSAGMEAKQVAQQGPKELHIVAVHGIVH